MNKYKVVRVGKRTIGKHRLVMQKYLGRKLIKGEVVHHINGNGLDNNLNNLMLFPTQKAHTEFHYEEGGSGLIAGTNKKKLIHGKLQCNTCNKFKEIKEFLTDVKHFLGVRGICKDCYNLRRRKRKQRPEL